MWARLKQVGWTWKQGSGLHPYSYFRPGANTSLRKGALEGRDYFSTEAAVVQFVKSRPVWKSKFYGAFVLQRKRRVLGSAHPNVLHCQQALARLPTAVSLLEKRG